MLKTGIIAGTGVAASIIKEPGVIVLNRHGREARMPHEIDYRGNIRMMKKAGVRRIIAIAAVGSINKNIRPGDFAVLTDFIDFTRGREAARSFIDLSEPYDRALRRLIVRAAGKIKLKIHPAAVYACAEGPRFETKAEIRMFRRLGADVVGMTQVPEVVLAAEAGIPYAAVAVATNYAAGAAAARIDPGRIVQLMSRRSSTIARLLREIIAELRR